MKQKEITLCGKQVTLGYSFATEIAFNDMADRPLPDFIREAIACLQSETMQQPDVKQTICAIVSASLAYAQATGTEPAITDGELMHHAEPEETGTALGTVIGLYIDFYHLSKSDREQQEKDAAKAKGKGHSKNR